MKSPTSVYIDIGGIAYNVNISLHTYGKLEELDKAKLFTHMIVRETEQSLYGFFDLEERELFSKLIQVKGIGPNTARVILSYMTPQETKSAILHDNVPAFKKVKGVGPKTAQQIILDLKNKITKESLEGDSSIKIVSSSIREEAISALIALGFQKSRVAKTVDKTLAEDTSLDQVENLIKAVLKQL